MKLDLNELVTNLGKTYYYEIKEDCGSVEYTDLHCVHSIVGKADFTNTGSLIIARGKLSTAIEVECARCLTKSTVPVEVTMEEQFPIVDPQALAAAKEELADEEEKDPLFENNLFDLSEFIRQSVLVQVPIRPLCSDDCKGLCLTCGKNLNEGPCDCPADLDASPFSALKQLLEKPGENAESD